GRGAGGGGLETAAMCGDGGVGRSGARAFPQPARRGGGGVCDSAAASSRPGKSSAAPFSARKPRRDDVGMCPPGRTGDILPQQFVCWAARQTPAGDTAAWAALEAGAYACNAAATAPTPVAMSP